jgi:hypothetical protein
MNHRVSLKVASMLLAAAFLITAVPVDAQDTATATTTTTSRYVAINQSVAQPQVPFQSFDGNPPKVFDINGDGQMEIIAQNDNNWFYVFDSKTGAILFQAKTTFPAGWGARTFNGPEIAILAEGGAPRIVVENSAAYITMYRYDHAGSTNSAFKFVKEWERRLDVCFSNPGSDSKPVLADLDRDGKLDIVASTEESGIYALRQDGSIMWSRCIGGGNAEPTVADITLDGYPEVVFASDGGIVTAMSGKGGTILWTFDARARYGLGSGSMPVGPAIGQLDGVGGPEIVVGARDSHNATVYSQNHALLLALKSNGQVLWAKQDPVGNPLTYTHAIIADAEGDGQNEVYWGDWNTMGHKPPWDEASAWARTGPANYYRYAADGSLVWKRTLDAWWSNKDLAIADADGDGIQEVLANGPDGRSDGIWYLDARNGALDAFVAAFPWKVARGAVVADLWNTGSMQWIIGAGLDDPSGGSHAVLIYDTHAAYNSVYPHLPYPALQPPIVEPGSAWGATFNIKAPNNWWQEVTVQPDTPHTVTAMDVRINGDLWRPLSKSSWGAWTASYNAPTSSKVEFRAFDTTNQASISLPFTWMDGTLSKRSVGSTPPTTTTTPPPTTTTTTPPTTTTTIPPPTTTSMEPTPTTSAPPGTFDARFTVSPNINEWWVEVTVGGNEAITKVDARVNGGTWRALSLRSWGNWAESFNVPKGSRVDFRATSSTGAQDTSDVVCWMSTSCGITTTPTTTATTTVASTTVPPTTTTATPTAFDANFFPKAVGNDWWVEVDVVASGHTISKVEAQVNGGTWRLLDKQSWGSWAKSFNVPNGSNIVFRATDSAGAQDLSSPVVWT